MFGAIACGGGADGTTPPASTNSVLASVGIKLADTVLVMGHTTQVTAQALDQTGKTMSGQAVTFESSDTLVASVDVNGTVMAQYEGRATIRARIGDKVAETTLTVLLDPYAFGAYFHRVPNAFPDLSTYYAQTAGSAFITAVVAADLNKDGRTDLAFHLWHMRTAVENLTLGPDATVPNRLVALLAQPNGTFLDKTAQLFGSAVVDLAGSASRKVRVADLNSDGLPDWVYASLREDGRPGGPGYYSQTAAVTSNGTGTYSVLTFGATAYHHSVDIAPSAANRFDVLLDNDEAYTLVGGGFSPVAGYPNRSSPTYVTVSDHPGDIPQSLVTTFNDATHVTVALRYYRREAGASWVEKTGFAFNDYRVVDYVAWNGDLTKNIVMTYKGREYVGGSFFESCVIRPLPNGKPLVVGLWSTEYLPSGSQGRTLLRQGEGLQYSTLMAFDIATDSLRPVDLISGEDANQNINFFDCKDVNGDGFEDIVTYPYRDGGQPLVYLNNGAGALVRMDERKLPKGPSGGQWTSLFADVDGDGVLDLVFYPGNGCATGQSCATYQLWRARRRLR